ncbi:MAG: glycosyltransferase family 4 protein, partial [Clostridiales bacterium]|nr:glycosyltransferase family 4 protein [Clostridiales bacterium]
MPNILSLNNYHYRRGGSDVVFLEHAEIFKQMGWGTAMFSMVHPNNNESPWKEYFIDELEFGGKYNFFDKLLMAAKVVYSLEAKKKLSKLLDDYPVDIAHSHCIYHHLSPSVLVELKAREIPSVMTAHDLKLACPAYKMLNDKGVCEECKNRNFLPLVKNRCIHDSLPVSTLVAIESTVHKLFSLYRKNLDRIIAPSVFYKNKLVEWGWESDSIEYIPNYIDAEKYTAQFKPGNYALYFGRLAPEKGIDTLIRSAVKLGIILKIAGTGPSVVKLKQLAYGCKNIQFLGYVGGNELWKLVQKSRVVVLPSEWYENAPISLLEAYACGKPVLGAQIGGIPEMVKEGETGMLFNSRDENSLTEKLETFFSMNDVDICTMGNAARNFVSQTFTKEKYT